ncbi:hypothetical protein D3C86_1016940 [compost metagenome]
MNTILPMLKLDPETEMKNLEKERGTVFDCNAPKVPAGAPGAAPSHTPPGSTPPSGSNPNVPTKPTGNGDHGTPSAQPPGSKGPNPQDFGFPGKGSPPAEKTPSPNDKSQQQNAPSSQPSSAPVGPKHSSNLSDFLERNGSSEVARTSTDSRSSQILKVRRQPRNNQEN